MEEIVLFSDDPRVFEDAVHRICHRYEYEHVDSVPSERVSVLWRVSGGDAVLAAEMQVIARDFDFFTNAKNMCGSISTLWKSTSKSQS